MVEVNGLTDLSSSHYIQHLQLNWEFHRYSLKETESNKQVNEEQKPRVFDNYKE